jgi:hypothetical protein
MRRLDDPRLIDAVLRHPAFVDRAPLERALSARFFAPFCHQEVTRGARFETRARWSRAIFAAVGLERVRDAAIRAFDAHAPTGESESLLDSVRACVARATTELTFGDLSLEPLVQRAVRDIDRSIKMIGRADLTVRRALRDALEPVLDCTDAWPEATSLGAARAEARCLPLSERVDHVGAVLLATGVIQVSDTVTHALIALAQHPAAAAASDDALVAEVVRAFPVNASITRAAGVDVTIEGARFQRGEAVTIVPRRRARALGFDPSRAAGRLVVVRGGREGVPGEAGGGHARGDAARPLPRPGGASRAGLPARAQPRARREGVVRGQPCSREDAARAPRRGACALPRDLRRELSARLPRRPARGVGRVYNVNSKAFSLTLSPGDKSKVDPYERCPTRTPKRTFTGAVAPPSFSSFTTTL